MNKLILLGAVIVTVLTAVAYTTRAQTTQEKKNMTTDSPKILIAYYSYSGNTKEVAEAIREKTGGELFEIKAEGTYPEEYRPMTVQAKKEIAANFRPKLLSKVADISKYDVIFIGSPNWWGTITPQVSSFLEAYDLSGKTVVPFITAWRRRGSEHRQRHDGAMQKLQGQRRRLGRIRQQDDGNLRLA